ncbi:MAG: GHMP kinase [Chloroflexi bacterium]|nr:GHMP kinase [Chloroflexota bacterium]
MLIARAPVRVSFFGGGTDLPAYYEQFGGAVLSAAIDKYFYVVLGNAEGSVQVSSSDYRTFFRHEAPCARDAHDDMRLPRAVLDEFSIYEGLSIFLSSEVPPGTGLGSSSTVTVALVKALSTYCGKQLTPSLIAELACDIEINRLAQPIGKQDQYAAAFGGLNFIEFRPDSSVSVSPLNVSTETHLALQRRVLLFFTGVCRQASSVLSQQRRNITENRSDTLRASDEMKSQAYRARDLLAEGRLDDFGTLLDDGWRAKKRAAASVTNERTDRAYEVARSAGALGAKVAGAGGGGFMIVFARDGYQQDIISALEHEGLSAMKFRFEPSGARVLVNALAA